MFYIAQVGVRPEDQETRAFKTLTEAKAHAYRLVAKGPEWVKYIVTNKDPRTLKSVNAVVNARKGWVLKQYGEVRWQTPAGKIYTIEPNGKTGYKLWG